MSCLIKRVSVTTMIKWKSPLHVDLEWYLHVHAHVSSAEWMLSACTCNSEWTKLIKRDSFAIGYDSVVLLLQIWLMKLPAELKQKSMISPENAGKFGRIKGIKLITGCHSAHNKWGSHSTAQTHKRAKQKKLTKNEVSYFWLFKVFKSYWSYTDRRNSVT